MVHKFPRHYAIHYLAWARLGQEANGRIVASLPLCSKWCVTSRLEIFCPLADDILGRDGGFDHRSTAETLLCPTQPCETAYQRHSIGRNTTFYADVNTSANTSANTSVKRPHRHGGSAGRKAIFFS